MDESNRVIVEAWNTVLYEKFCRFRHLLVEGLSQHSDAAFDRCRYPEGARVLDVGCGFGDSTLQIARRVGPAGEIIRLAGEEGAKRKPQVVAALKATLASFARPEGIWAPSSTWFITATNPS